MRGFVTLVYAYTQNDLPAMIAGIRNKNKEIIRVSLQTPVSRSRRLEEILVENDGAQIRALAERLKGLTGIESVKVTTIPTGNQRDMELFQMRWDTGMENPVADVPEKIS